MGDTSRVSTAARALGHDLEALADALVQVRGDAIAASESLIETRVRAFAAAAADAGTSGDTLAPAAAAFLSAALQRCRRLGASLALCAVPGALAADTPHGYTPVGQILPPAGEGSLLTARG
jgi:hypothetical protein